MARQQHIVQSHVFIVLVFRIYVQVVMGDAAGGAITGLLES